MLATHRSPRPSISVLPLWPLLLAASLLVTSGTARAQAGTDDEHARLEFEVGRTAYDAAHYAEALAAFERSYALSARPQLLYNIAQAADRLRRDERALEAFEQFLATVPDTPLRVSVSERITLLRAAIAARQPAQAAGSTQPPRLEPEHSLLGPVVLLSVGGLLAAGGAVSLGVGLGDRASVEGAPDGTRLVEVRSAAERAPLLMDTGLVLLGVGLAAASVGLIWLLVPPSSEDARSLAVAAAVGGVVVTGTF